MSRAITFTESQPFQADTVLDRESGVVKGVAVCGFVSANGRDYPRPVLERDHSKYENAQVYIDHADGERKVREWFGTLKNVRLRADGKPVADLHYPKTGGFTAEFEERAQRFPGSFGLSHVAVCDTKRINGREVIEAIRRVESVDLVARPATNKSLFESQRLPMKLKEYVAALSAKFPADARVKTLAEMDGMGGEMDMPEDAPPIDAAVDAGDPVQAAFKQAMHGLVDQYDSGELTGEELVKKLKMLTKTAEKLAGQMTDTGGGKGDSEPPEMESLKKQLDTLTKENAALKVGQLFREAGVNPTDVLTEAALALPDEAKRKALIESFRKPAGEKPVSQERKATTATTTITIPTEGKAFAESLRKTK